MPSVNDNQSLRIVTLKLLYDDIESVAQKFARQLKIAEDLGIETIEVPYLDTAKKSLVSLNNFAEKVKVAIVAATETSPVHGGDKQAQAASIKRTVKAKMARKNPFAVDPKTGKPFPT